MKIINEQPISWHTAFLEAIELELQEYKDILEFLPEFQLSSEPLKIDCVVIKKAENVVIKKNIAAIFREVNLLEYKSPNDYISIADFYKVYGYACLYASIERAPITSLTVTFVESRYPKKLLEHLNRTRGYSVEKTNPGIYTVSGDILPIQIIDSRKLSPEENLWLKGLSNRLDPLALIRIGEAIKRQGKVARVQAYIDTITKANLMALEEAIRMSAAAKSLDEVFERTGLAAKWEARGEAKGRYDIAQQMVHSGFPAETVVSITKLDPEKVKELANTTNQTNQYE